MRVESVVHSYHFLQAAYYSVRLLRSMFDLLSGYTWGKMFDSLDEKKWLTRIIYLETVAGVPGIVCVCVCVCVCE